MSLPLHDSLTQHLTEAGVENPAEEAKKLLIQRGHMREDGTLTAEGLKRDALGTAGRAKHRAAKATGKHHTNFYYDPVAKKAKAIK